MNDFYMNLIKFLVNIMDGFVTVTVMHIYFSEKIRLRVFVCNALFIGLSIYLLNAITMAYPDIMPLGIAVPLFCIVTASAKFSVNKKIKDILLPVVLFSFLNMLFSFITFLLSQVLGLEIDYILNSLVLIPLNLFYYMIDFSMMYLLRKISLIIQYKYKIDKRHILLIMAYSLLLFVMLTININIVIWHTGEVVGLYIPIVFLAIFLVYISLNLIFYLSLCKSEHVKKELLDLQYYCESIKSNNQKLHIIKHGYDNTLASINGFVHEEEWEQLVEYLVQVMGVNEKSGDVSLEEKEIAI